MPYPSLSEKQNNKKYLTEIKKADILRLNTSKYWCFHFICIVFIHLRDIYQVSFSFDIFILSLSWTVVSPNKTFFSNFFFGSLIWFLIKVILIVETFTRISNKLLLPVGNYLDIWLYLFRIMLNVWRPAKIIFPDVDFNTKCTISSNSNHHVNRAYLVIDVFPKVHGKELKWHHKRPSHVIKIRVTKIRIGSSIWQTRVVHWTSPEKNRIELP